MYVPERLNINLSTVPFVLKEVHVLIDVWSSACLCVSWSGGGFQHQGIWVLQLVMVQHWSNRQVGADEWEATANDRSTTPFSGCVAPGHLSGAEMDIQTWTHTSHSLISRRLVFVATQLSSIFPWIFFSCPHSIFFSLQELNPVWFLFLSLWLIRREKLKDTRWNNRTKGLKAVWRRLPSSQFSCGNLARIKK